MYVCRCQYVSLDILFYIQIHGWSESAYTMYERFNVL